MNFDLITAIRMLEKISFDNQNYSTIFMFTNENINGFTSKLSFIDNKVLTVCSSGDQAFNLILNGASEVDLFDINIFSKYYFYLKKAAISALDYNEFLDFFFPKKFKNKTFDFITYLDIRKSIDDDEARNFWDYLFCHYSGSDIYNSNMFYKLNYSKRVIIGINDYLSNKDNYNKLKELLYDKKFNFYNIDLFSDKIPSDTKYDFIYLSNIFDYLMIKDKLEYANKIKEIIVNLKNNISDTGMIAISYLYLYYDEYWKNDYYENLKSENFRNTYFNDDYEYVQFPGVFATRDNQLRNKDALMLYRKKN